MPLSFHTGIGTGQALTFPCAEAVSTYPVRVEGDIIFVRLDLETPATVQASS